MSTKKVVLPDKAYEACLTTDCDVAFFYANKDCTQDAQVEFPKWLTDLLLERVKDARAAGRKEIRERMRGLLGVSD